MIGELFLTQSKLLDRSNKIGAIIGKVKLPHDSFLLVGPIFGITLNISRGTMFKFLKLRLQPLDVRGTEGDRLELNCQARGSPPPRCCLELITSLTMAISLLA